MGLFDILRGNAYTNADKNKLDGIDPNKYVTIEMYNELLEKVNAIPEMPDTVKYIENSNPKSEIKKISLSIDDKGTFKAEANPINNISHTI